MSGDRVLVTGGSGFVGAHCIVQLLKAGYRVRATVRSRAREKEVRAMVAAGGAPENAELTLVEVDLTKDDGWSAAALGCPFVLHVASPFPAGAPKHEDDIIVPAREGALRVLRAARDANVKRVVLTSSFAAIGYGHAKVERPFTEEDWTDPHARGLTAYVRSKVLAERAAWDFIAREGGALELTVVNPVGIFGPILGRDYSASIQLLKRMLDGGMPALPRLSFGVVDVRDVADLHLRAMVHPAAKGQRYLGVAGEPMTLESIAHLLKDRAPDISGRISTRRAPSWLLRLMSLWTPSLAQVVPELGKVKRASHAKAARELGWSPRSNEEAILSAARSLAVFGEVATRSETAA